MLKALKVLLQKALLKAVAVRLLPKDKSQTELYNIASEPDAFRVWGFQMLLYFRAVDMRTLIQFLFGKKSTFLEEPDPMKKYLVVGLGNIGQEYIGTRHNVGFQVLDTLAQKQGFSFEPGRLGDIGIFKIKGRSVFCLKPSTYMNRSGKAVKYWLEKEKIPLENLLVITDDINLPFGSLRLKTKGSDGGHNGLKDIQQQLETQQYSRLRFGVGSEFGKGGQVNYVLSPWLEEENKVLGGRLERGAEFVGSFILAGAKITMNQYNGT
ncbi:MAG: aminoacyl-tRNA hydrolase [Flavobacteriaceae bacterium]